MKPRAARTESAAPRARSAAAEPRVRQDAEAARPARAAPKAAKSDGAPKTARAKAPAAALPGTAARKPTAPKAAAGKGAAAGTAAGRSAKPAAGARQQEAAAGPAGAPAPRSAARPARKAPKRVKVSPPMLERLVAAAVASLEDDKAENVVVLDIATRSSFADRMIIATGLADRQIQAMAQHLDEALEAEGLRRIRREVSPDWVLMDGGDLVIHLFKPEARDTYALERMWGPGSPTAEGAPDPASGEEPDAEPDESPDELPED